MHVVIRMEDKQKSVGNGSSDVRNLANIIRTRVPEGSIKWFVELRRFPKRTRVIANDYVD